MDMVLRSLLFLGSLVAFLLCMTRIKQAKLKVSNSVVWMLGSIVLVFMSIFFHVVVWISDKLGFVSPSNFVFFIIIAFLLVQAFIDNIRISSLNEKIKDLNHYIALKEYDSEKE